MIIMYIMFEMIEYVVNYVSIAEYCRIFDDFLKMSGDIFVLGGTNVEVWVFAKYLFVSF